MGDSPGRAGSACKVGSAGKAGTTGNVGSAYGLVTDDGLNGLPYVLYGFLMLVGLNRLP